MNNLKKYILFLLLVATSFFSFSQELTKIKGQVVDATTKQPMPFVNVVFVGANVGATTDFDGNYYIETQWATSKLMASFIGIQKTVMRGASRPTALMIGPGNNGFDNSIKRSAVRPGWCQKADGQRRLRERL